MTGIERMERDGTRTQCNRRLALAAMGLGMTAGVVRGADSFALPKPRPGTERSLNATLASRRSIRSYAPQALALSDVSELLWAAQGVSGAGGLRTAPSAGALYPLELHVIARRVDGLHTGVWRYAPSTHALDPTLAGSAVPPLLRTAGDQPAIARAPLVIAIAAVHGRTAAKYGQRAPRYVAFEAGAASQNIALQAASLGLGTVVIGAFDDDAVARALQLPPGEKPLALMPVGRPA
jgi:SagB-type dehydrogenase family enzyme